MKIELVCKNCGGKVFEMMSSSRKMGGWSKDGERVWGRDSFYCKKCMCDIDIEYYDRKGKYVMIYDPKIKRSVVHVIRDGYAISLITGRKTKHKPKGKFWDKFF